VDHCVRADLAAGAAKIAVENETLCHCLRNQQLDAVAGLVKEVGTAPSATRSSAARARPDAARVRRQPLGL